MKEWDKCKHCKGSGHCGCGDCRVYEGSGYSTWRFGICLVCKGEGGKWIDAMTGQPFEPDQHVLPNLSKRR